MPLIRTGHLSNNPSTELTEISQDLNNINPDGTFVLEGDGSFTCCFDSEFEIIESDGPPFSNTSEGSSNALPLDEWHCLDILDGPFTIKFTEAPPSKIVIRLYDEDTISSVSLSEQVENSDGEIGNIELLGNPTFDNRETFYFDCNDDLTFDRDDYIGWIMGFTVEELHPLDVPMSTLCTDDPCINSQLYSVNLIENWHYENGS